MDYVLTLNYMLAKGLHLFVSVVLAIVYDFSLFIVRFFHIEDLG